MAFICPEFAPWASFHAGGAGMASIARAFSCAGTCWDGQYERQRHQPAFEIVRKLAQVLKMPPANFYADDEKLAELIAIYGRLSAIKRLGLLTFARKATAG